MEVVKAKVNRTFKENLSRQHNIKPCTNLTNLLRIMWYLALNMGTKLRLVWG